RLISRVTIPKYLSEELDRLGNSRDFQRHQDEHAHVAAWIVSKRLDQVRQTRGSVLRKFKDDDVGDNPASLVFVDEANAFGNARKARVLSPPFLVSRIQVVVKPRTLAHQDASSSRRF